MADLASTDVTVTVNDRDIVGRKRRNRVTIAFGDGALTYPAGGVPMPAASSFGMVRNLDFLTVFDAANASGIIWKYDRANNKLRAYIQGHNTSGAGTAGLIEKVIATADLPTSTARAAVASGAAASGVFLTGVMQELAAASSAPAAQTLQAEAVGW